MPIDGVPEGRSNLLTVAEYFRGKGLYLGFVPGIGR